MKIHRFTSLLLIIFLALGWNFSTVAQEVLPQIVYVKLENNPANVYKSSQLTTILGELESLSNGKITPAIQPKLIDRLTNSGTVKKGINKTIMQSSIEELKQWYKVVLPFDQDPIQFTQKWKNRRGVVSVVPHYLRTIAEIPNDTLYSSSKFNYEKMYFPEAWDTSKSDTSIVIAIVDSGVNYNHEDLKSKLWKNSNEIPNNGIDDDNNGWIDDDKGWDFWESGSLSETPIEDNDPNGNFEDHGTHVAGIAAAEVNNKIGLPGAGWNSRYMAIKAGGTKDNPRVIAFGYEGIVYAMVNGADIINCSWGGNGSSQYEQDIVNAALAAGCVIVAAAGNENAESVYFPAAYPGVIAVGSVSSSYSKSSFTNYGYHLDVMATGSLIKSTSFNHNYSTKSGTSMSSPYVAGMAALLKSLHPDWTPKQIRNQLRASSTYLDPLNAKEYNGKLGRGMINGKNAFNRVYPGFIVTNFKLENSEGQKLRPNQSGFIRITLEQTGLSENNTDFKFSTETNGIQLVSPNRSIPNLGLGGTIDFDIEIELSSDFSPFTVPVFQIIFQQFNFGYIDYNYIAYDELIFEEHDNSGIKVSMASDGTVGFVDPLNSKGGVGFIPKETNNITDDPQNILYSSSLMIRQGQHVADRAINTNGTDKDILPINFYEIINNGDQRNGIGNAAISHNQIPALEIQTKSFTIDKPEVSQVLWINYLVSNPTANSVDSIYVGMFADWDIADYSVNKVGFLSEENLIYAFDTETEQYAGMAILNPIGGALAINNAFEGTETDVDFGLYYSSSNPNTLNGFTNSEKVKSLSAGLRKTSINTGTDISAIIYSSKFELPSNSKASFGFVWVYGKSLEEMKTQFEAAKTYNLFPITTPETVSNESLDESKPVKFSIIGNYPNPFNPSTNLKIVSGKPGEVKLEIFDILGKKVINQTFLIQSGASNYTIMMPKQASGIYFARIYFDGRMYQHKMMLIK